MLFGFFSRTIVKRDYDGTKELEIPHDDVTKAGFQSGLIGISSEGSTCYMKFEKLNRKDRLELLRRQNDMKKLGILEEEDQITGYFDEVNYCDTIGTLEELNSPSSPLNMSIHVSLNSYDMYEAIQSFADDTIASIDTKYKTVDKKVKPVASPLPKESQEKIDGASKQPSLRDPKKIGHTFTPESLQKVQIGGDNFLTPIERQNFLDMIGRHGKAFSFHPHEIGCVDPNIVSPMIIFTIPHIPWNLRPIPVPKAHLSKLIELLKEKIDMGILEPSCAPYSNRWFTVPKKSGALRFI